MFRIKLLVSLLLAQALLSSVAVAQKKDSLVLNVTVTTKKGTVIPGLTQENFSISVDKQLQKILSVSGSEVPASIGIVIDTSGSQGTGGTKAALQVQQQFKQGLEGFFKKSNPDNEYFALAFNSKTQLVQDWTTDYQSILGKLDSLTFSKQTSMYDALRQAIEKMPTGRLSKQVLILISDGADNWSKASFKEVRDLLKSSDVTLYCVALNNVFGRGDITSVPNLEGEGVLTELTYLSGGRVLFMNNSQGAEAFNEVFDLIALELRNQYQVVIEPSSSVAGKNWRQLKVTASRGGASGRAEELVARTRQMY